MKKSKTIIEKTTELFCNYNLNEHLAKMSLLDVLLYIYYQNVLQK